MQEESSSCGYSAEVAGTISTLSNLFSSTFPLNQDDDSKNIPGILYGRYQGDHYDSELVYPSISVCLFLCTSPHVLSDGNPWILTSGCLAQLYYRGAAEALRLDSISYELAHAWSTALHNQTGPRYQVEDLMAPASLAKALASAGDGVLLRIRYHTAPLGFHQPEQVDKQTGALVSAYDLTWSYATILKAMAARSSAL